MKKLSFKLFIVIFALGITLVGCKKDDDVKPDEGQPDDTTIPIDDNSAFNMKNFIVSFNQMFTSNERWAWNFTHNYTDGKAVTSFQNQKRYGKFGNNIQTVTHNYDSKGIITSSERSSIWDDDNDILTFEYEYDLNGYIIKHTKKNQEELNDIVNLEYNSNGQLMKKSHEAIEVDDEVWTETFTYNSEGSVSIYENSRGGNKYEYTYSNGNMVEVKRYSEGVLDDVKKYEYDNEGRVTKMYEDGDTWYEKIEYSSEILTYFSYDGDLLEYKGEYGVGLKQLKSWRYSYDDSNVFMYCTAKENDEDGRTKKKSYYEGTATNLQLVGYSIIDSRDTESTKKTKESIYNSSANKLYYAEFTVVDGSITETNWFNAAGSSITTGDITESWVFILVK